MASGDYMLCSIPAAVNSTIKDEIRELRAMMKGLALDDFPPCPRGEGEPRESRCGITALQYLSFNTLEGQGSCPCPAQIERVTRFRWKYVNVRLNRLSCDKPQRTLYLRTMAFLPPQQRP
jgi:hypothetical protein